MGDWKCVERANAPTFSAGRNKRTAEAAEKKKTAGPKRDELFNLKQDPSETQNLWTANKDRAVKMKKFLDESRARGFTRPGAGE